MKLVLFDLDGTLVKAGGAGKLALNKALKMLYGKNDVCSSIFLAGSTDKDNFHRAYTIATGKKPAKEHLSSIEKTYLSLLPTEVETAVKLKRYKKIGGIEKFLKTLSTVKGLYIGLGTGNLKEGAYIKLEPSGLSGYFIVGGFGCDGHTRVHVLKAAVKRAEKMFKTSFPPNDIYVIGDTHKDISSAKELGFHCAAITDGYGDIKDIMHECPELAVKDFSDIATWLVWLGIKADPKGVERGCYIFPDCAIEHVQFGRSGVDQLQLKLLRKIKQKGRNACKK